MRLCEGNRSSHGFPFHSSSIPTIHLSISVPAVVHKVFFAPSPPAPKLLTELISPNPRTHDSYCDLISTLSGGDAVAAFLSRHRADAWLAGKLDLRAISKPGLLKYMKQTLEDRKYLVRDFCDEDAGVLHAVLLALDLVENPNGLLKPLQTLLLALLQEDTASTAEAQQITSSLIGACMKALSGLLSRSTKADIKFSNAAALMRDILFRYPDNGVILSAFRAFLAAFLQYAPSPSPPTPSERHFLLEMVTMILLGFRVRRAVQHLANPLRILSFFCNLTWQYPTEQ